MNGKVINKSTLWIALCIVAFAIITLVYFSPVLQGKRLKQHDIEMYKGAAQEVQAVCSAWNNFFTWSPRDSSLGLLQADSSVQVAIGEFSSFGCLFYL